MTETSADDAIDLSKLSIADKLTHKTWKVRVAGYEELRKEWETAEDLQQAFRPYSSDDIRKMCSDSNQIALESAFTAVSYYVENADGAVRSRATIVPILIEKCLASMRAGTRSKSAEIIKFYVDIDISADGVVSDLIAALAMKQPKIVSASVALIKEIVQYYGPKSLNFKLIFKCLVGVFGHSDKNVRAEATQLAVELYKWTGKAAFDTAFAELKPVQVKEMNDLFESVTDKPAQTCFLRCQNANAVPEQAENDDMDIDTPAESAKKPVEEVDNKIDPFDLADPVDVLSKIPDSFYDNVRSTNWKERKEALEYTAKVLNVTRMADGSYHSLVSALGKAVADSNILCSILTVNCIESLAKGLPMQFNSYKSSVVGPLLERLKEKKQTVQQAIRAALEAIFFITSLSELVEDISSGLGNKNPQVKSETTLWLCFCLSNTTKAPSKEDIKLLMTALLKTIEDSTTTVRDSSALAIGTLKKLVGDRGVASYLDKLDPIRLAKIEEACQNATVKALIATASMPKSGSSSSIYTRAAPAKPVLKKKPTVGKENSAPSLSASSKALTKSVGTLKKKPISKSGTISRSSAAVSSAKEIDEPVRYKFTDDQANDAISNLLTDDLIAKLKDIAWKSRLEAMDTILGQMDGLLSAEPPSDPEMIIRIMRKQPIWKDNNFQVTGRLFQIIIACAQKKADLSSGAISIALPILVDKLGDAKLKVAATDALKLFIDQSSLQFVFTQCYEPIIAQKSPKVTSDALKVISSILMEFGVSKLNVKQFLDFVKVNLASSNAAVRSAAVVLLGNLRVFIGPEIKTLLTDISPAQMATIEAEFQSVANVPIPEKLRGQALEKKASSGTVYVAASNDDLFPRLDLGSAVSSECLLNIESSNWKLRKEGLDYLMNMLQTTHTKIKPNLGELLSALKARSTDSNKNLVIQTLEILSLIAVAMGPPFERLVKNFLPGVLSNLSDNKAQVRQAVTSTLEKFLDVVKFDTVLAAVATTLGVDNPNSRRELLSWLPERLSVAYRSAVDGSVLISPVFVALQDRSQDVRKAAHGMLPSLVRLCGYDSVRAKCSELKGTAIQTVLPAVEALRLEVENNVTQEAPSLVLEAKPAAVSNLTREHSVSSLSRSNSKLTLNKRKLGPSKMASSSSLKVDSAEPTHPLLLSDLKLKEKRADQDKGLHKWTFDVPRKDLTDFLRDQADAVMSETLVAQLFSEDHHKDKDFYNGMSALDDSLVKCIDGADDCGVSPDESKLRFIAASDIIFKYLTIRFFDTNTSTLLKILDLLEHLFTVLDDASYQLSDYEANAFLPFFISKVGDSKETIRSRIRSSMRTICRIYPASKMFTQILACIGAKNSKVRTECLEELGCLIQRNGSSVYSPAKALTAIALQIADRDSGVRTAALNVIVEAYGLIGDTVYKYLKGLSEKDKSLLEERIKRSKVQAPPSTSTRRLSSSPVKGSIELLIPSRQASSESIVVDHNVEAASNSNRHFSLDLDKLALPQLSNPTNSKHPSNVQRMPDFSNAASSGSQDQSEFAMDFIQTQVTSGDAYQSIEALKNLEKYIDTRPELVKAQMNPLVNAVTLQVRLAFTSPVVHGHESATLLRQCKHLVNVLVQMFSVKEFATELHKETTHQLLCELLARLVDQTLQNSLGENGIQLTRALNVLMIRILENCNKNLVFGVLLDLLDTGVASLRGLPHDVAVVQSKYSELVMKCVWKWTKALQTNLKANEINIGQLLSDIHKFLTTNPPIEWKRRATDQLPLGDMPLRTAKTIMHELCVGVGGPILDEMLQCGVDEPRRSVVFSYLSHMLEAAGVTVPKEPVHATSAKTIHFQPEIVPSRSSSSNSVGMTNVSPLSDSEVVAAIDAIFNKIASKDDTKQGVMELYEFQKVYYQHHDKVYNKLSQQGVNFRMYIRNTLERIAKERGESLSDFSSNATVSVTSASSLETVNITQAPTKSDTDDYKERLMRLQQRFGYSTSLKEVKSQSSSDNTIPEAQIGSIEKDEKDEIVVPAPLSSQEHSVLALKERLARMKNTMRA